MSLTEVWELALSPCFGGTTVGEQRTWREHLFGSLWAVQDGPKQSFHPINWAVQIGSVHSTLGRQP